MKKIDFKKQNIPFTQVANGMLHDSKLTLTAKGLYAYLYSKPEGWDFSANRIAKESNNGRDSIRNALNELVDTGYLLRQKQSSGRILYKVIFPPIWPEPENTTLGIKPKPEKATDGKSHRRLFRPISNKEFKVIKRETNKDKDFASQSLLKGEIDELTRKFKINQ